MLNIIMFILKSKFDTSTFTLHKLGIDQEEPEANGGE